MKKTFMISALALFASISQLNSFAQDCAELFISEYVDGTLASKAIEIYNPTDQSISLATYKLEFYFNGNSIPSGAATFNFPAQDSIAAYGTKVVVNPNADQSLLARADYTFANLVFNGNDVVTLKKGTRFIDIIGEIGVNPSSGQGGTIGWTDSTGQDWTYQQIIRRKYGITKGVTDSTLAFYPPKEWTLHNNTDFTNVGRHNSVCTELNCIGTTLFADAGADSVCTSDEAQIGGVPSAGGGSGSYTWSWSPTNNIQIPPITNPIVSPPSSQYYFLEVTDNGTGCKAYDSIWVEINANCAGAPSCTWLSLVSAAQTQDVSCRGFNDGRIALTPAQLGNTYAWSNGASTAVVNNLTAGSYSVTVTNGNCTQADTFMISQPSSGVASTIVVVNETVTGAGDGSLFALVTGGTPAYQFEWSNGTTTALNGGLHTGNYTLTVTDANGCFIVDTAFVGLDSSTVNCNGLFADAGADSVCTSDEAQIGGVPSAGGGSGSFTWSWSPSNNIQIPPITNPIVSPPSSQYYFLEITDNQTGCKAYDSIWVEINANCLGAPSCTWLTLVTNVQTQNVSCNGLSDGRIALAPAQLGNSYTWSNGANTAVVNNLAAGSYSVTVTNGNCTQADTFTISQPALINISFTIVNESAAGAADGTVSTVVTGGTSPYQYNWSNGATTASLSNLAAGNYILTVTDANSCSSIKTAVVRLDTINPVDSCNNFSVSISSTNETAPNQADGTANATVSGGTPLYQYSWSTGATTPGITGLTAGTYTLEARDNRGCIARDTVIITTNSVNPCISNPVTATTTATNQTAPGANNGSATVIASGSTAPYTYTWSNGGTTSTINNLAAGTYTVTVVSGNNCTTTATATVGTNTIPCNLVANVSTTDLTATGANNGTASATATGGTSPYAYSWSTGATSASINSLAPGTYSVTVTDGNGCSDVASGIVYEFNQNPCNGFNASIAATAETSTGANNGTAQVTPTGGSAPYTYIWNTGATNSTLINLSPGTYIVTVSDAQGCAVSKIATILPFDTNGTVGIEINKGFLENLTLAPNPVEDQLTLSGSFVNAGNQVYTIRMFQLNGQLVRQFEHVVLSSNLSWSTSVEELTSGMYFIQIQGAEGIKTLPFVVK